MSGVVSALGVVAKVVEFGIQLKRQDEKEKRIERLNNAKADPVGYFAQFKSKRLPKRTDKPSQ